MKKTKQQPNQAGQPMEFTVQKIRQRKWRCLEALHVEKLIPLCQRANPNLKPMDIELFISKTDMVAHYFLHPDIDFTKTKFHPQYNAKASYELFHSAEEALNVLRNTPDYVFQLILHGNAFNAAPLLEGFCNQRTFQHLHTWCAETRKQIKVPAHRPTEEAEREFVASIAEAWRAFIRREPCSGKGTLFHAVVRVVLRAVHRERNDPSKIIQRALPSTWKNARVVT